MRIARLGELLLISYRLVVKQGMQTKTKGYDYDDIAEGIFAPLFPVVADSIIRHTGVTSGHMLDVGCGGGHLGYNLMKKTELTGDFIDILPEAADICRRRGQDWGLAGRVTVTVGDVHRLPYPDDRFDLIISRGSIGFWGEYESAFREIYRVLAPHGTTYIGSGLGNAETRREINRQMKARDPDWPHSIKKKQHNVSTDEFRAIFDAIGFSYDIIDNEDEGRWFILRKDGP